MWAEDRAENKSLSISNSYATGNVATTDNDGATAGRFIGNNIQFDGFTISNSFYSTNSTVTLPSDSSETTGFGVEKSATEFKKLSTFSGDGWTWNMTTDRTLNKNTILSPTLVADNQGVMHWVMPLYTTALNYTLGTKNKTVAKVIDNIVPPIPTPPPSTPSTSDGRTKEKTTTVVTTTTPSGSIAAPTVQAIDVTALVKLAVPALSGSTSEFTLVSQANNTEVSKVTMEELTTKAPNSEIRVALGGDSLVALVNGGVNLPDGVSQEFYVVEEK